ncbi:proteasome subunit beta type-6-like [Zingiber officinale]|uniref:proteasome subunit beta type-6-like n=1 Tax=Zingiber officinale TaxID=94328 RepID=UPI001C4C2364|nr:proteasome subunit beta type-6-like [Zingiber officinale]
MDLNAPHGTTIVGVTYDGVVVLGADSRVTLEMGVTIDSMTNKIIQLTDKIYICRSGPAAASEVLSDYVRNICLINKSEIQFGQPAKVKDAANLVRLFSYKNKNMRQMGVIVGGWDKYEGGQIFAVPPGGAILKLPFAIEGSGSRHIRDFVDMTWREGMGKVEAELFVIKVVSRAIAKDEASGGLVRTVTINSDGAIKNSYTPDDDEDDDDDDDDDEDDDDDDDDDDEDDDGGDEEEEEDDGDDGDEEEEDNGDDGRQPTADDEDDGDNGDDVDEEEEDDGDDGCQPTADDEDDGDDGDDGDEEEEEEDGDDGCQPTADDEDYGDDGGDGDEDGGRTTADDDSDDLKP